MNAVREVLDVFLATVIRRAALGYTLAILTLAGLSAAAQQPAATVTPVLSDAQIEEFLLKAEIGDSKEISQGINNTRRASLSHGGITHDAQIQDVDVSMLVFNPPGRPAELNFKDSYRYNIAAYKLSRLLGVLEVPVSVERRVGAKSASVTWWIDNVRMDERARMKNPKTGWPAARTWAQVYRLRVFDALIANTDRNVGNILWTTDGTLWMIDHTRAFRLWDKLTSPNVLVRCERNLLAAMRKLTEEGVEAAVGNSLTGDEIEAMLKRRDLIVQLFDAKIAKNGEHVALYGLDDK